LPFNALLVKGIRATPEHAIVLYETVSKPLNRDNASKLLRIAWCCGSTMLRSYIGHSGVIISNFVWTRMMCFKTFLSGKPANTIAPFQVNIIALQCLAG